MLSLRNIVLVFFIFHITISGYGKIHAYPNQVNDYLPDNQYLKYNKYNQNYYSDYLAINSDYSESLSSDFPKQPERESPLRRFEITFFLSAPFVFIITFAGLHAYGAIRKQSTNVSVWKDYKPALLIGTFGISSAIAAREAWITNENNNKKKYQISDKQAYYFYASKKF